MSAKLTSHYGFCGTRVVLPFQLLAIKRLWVGGGGAASHWALLRTLKHCGFNTIVPKIKQDFGYAFLLSVICPGGPGGQGGRDPGM